MRGRCAAVWKIKLDTAGTVSNIQHMDAPMVLEKIDIEDITIGIYECSVVSGIYVSQVYSVTSEVLAAGNTLT